MKSFEAPREDILFSLSHVAQARQVPGWDAELVADILAHFSLLSENVLAPLNASGDAMGARLENGQVRMPDGFHAAFEQLSDGGWQGLTLPQDAGGMGQSSLVGAAVSEVFSGANHALQMICNLVPGAAQTLLRFGTAEQQSQWLPRLASGNALSTMCLTEPGAGSDLSQIRCRATPKGDHWQITGEKIFISGGDQDLSDSILHLVLARSGPETGLSGLSLFLCPKGPGVTVTRIEEKLGLHASPTCQMRFDSARGDLVGEAGAGLKAMFTLMNHARLDVALQGVAHGARAADLSRAWAEERMQGRKDDGSPAALIDHADVRRMLNEQDALAMGARAMCHLALVALETDAAPVLAEFLTPLCKVFGSEAGIRAADLGIQILGGYGYLTEYGMDQIWRDARITAIYEGANGVHERSLATRGLRGGGAEAFAAYIRNLAPNAPGILAELAQWEALADQTRAAGDPTALAHDFAQAAARLFYHVAWDRIYAERSHHSDPVRITRLARHVLGTIEPEPAHAFSKVSTA